MKINTIVEYDNKEEEEYMNSLYKGDCGIDRYWNLDDPLCPSKRPTQSKPIEDLTDEELINKVCSNLVSHFKLRFGLRAEKTGNSEWNPYDKVLNSLEDECEKRRGFFKDLFRKGQKLAKLQEPLIQI